MMHVGQLYQIKCDKVIYFYPDGARAPVNGFILHEKKLFLILRFRRDGAHFAIITIFRPDTCQTIQCRIYTADLNHAELKVTK